MDIRFYGGVAQVGHLTNANRSIISCQLYDDVWGEGAVFSAGSDCEEGVLVSVCGDALRIARGMCAGY